MLSYPLDINYILRKKKQIKRSLLSKNVNFLDKKIAVLGGSSTSEVLNIIEIFLLQIGIKPIFYESEYNKYFEDALFGNERLKNFRPDLIYIHTSIVNITAFASLSNNFEEINNIFNIQIEKFKSIWKALERFNCPIIQNNFDFPSDRSLGNLDCYDIHGKTFFINRLNQEFAKHGQEINNFYINDINYLSAYIGLNNWFDRSLWYKAKYALSMQAIPELAFCFSKIVGSIYGKTKKCLILDLDNTCWGGVIGDDGLGEIYIGEDNALSEAYLSFQKYIKELKNRGITLAVCSKNDFNNAKEGFLHPETILKFDDFTSFVANWDPKDVNILKIAKEINIDTNSLVFIDDSAFERSLVKAQVPDVSVPNIGSDICHFINYIDQNGFFEPISISEDDLRRVHYYHLDKKRTQDSLAYEDYDDFLNSLDMKAEIKSFDSIYIDRIAQLTNKTNQFNLTSKRYTVGELKLISNDENYIKIYGKLRDKYGENGLIAISIGRIEKDICHIDLWLMSCRVLSRNMEFAMLDEMVSRCISKGLTKIIGYYFQSSKNKMVSDMYNKFGFSLIEQNGSDSVWELSLAKYKKKNKFIRITNG